MGAPPTLPANFTGWDKGPPQTLPANFDQWDKVAKAQQTAPDQFAQDRAVTEAWAAKHPILGPIARFLVAGGQNAASAITDTPSFLYHAITDPPRPEESSMTPEQRVVARLGVEQAVKAGQDYASGMVTPKGAASVLPEALGAGVGQTAGGAVYAKAGEAVPPALEAASNVPLSKMTAPIRAGVKGANAVLAKAPAIAGGAVGGYLGHATGIPGAEALGAAAGYAAGKEVPLPSWARVPGQGFGLPNRVAGGPEVAPKYAPPPPETATMPPSTASVAKPATLSDLRGAIDQTLGVKPRPPMVPGVPIRNQPAAQAALPEGFTPVESSWIKGFKYNPDTREFETLTKGGGHYVHGDVSPEDVANFEQAKSKGNAWPNTIGTNAQVGQYISGKRVSTKPIAQRSAAPEAPKESGLNEGGELMDQLNKSLAWAKARK
jgi:hypothetical protein